VAPRREVAGDPALTAADLERRSTGRRDDVIEEAVAKLPVGIEVWCPRPREPSAGPVIPSLRHESPRPEQENLGAEAVLLASCWAVPMIIEACRTPATTSLVG
jgi:hypothetical protein